jgi:hypothetical protein
MLSNSSIGFADEVLEKVSFNKLCIVNKVLLYKNGMKIFHFNQIVQSCFYQSKVIVLMRGILFDNFQKVCSGLGGGAYFAFFKKISNGLPFLDGRVPVHPMLHLSQIFQILKYKANSENTRHL